AAGGAGVFVDVSGIAAGGAPLVDAVLDQAVTKGGILAAAVAGEDEGIAAMGENGGAGAVEQRAAGDLGHVDFAAAGARIAGAKPVFDQQHGRFSRRGVAVAGLPVGIG